VRVSTENGPKARYVVYQKHSGNFADTTMCEAGPGENGQADAQATWLCKDALGGEPLVGSSSGERDWTAYLITGSASSMDSFGRANDGCTFEAPGDVTASLSGATGTATGCRSRIGEWAYEWTGGATYNTNYSGCDGDSDYACAGATFGGYQSYCKGEGAQVCAGSTFTAQSYCTASHEGSCVQSKFKGAHSYCNGKAVNGCVESSFSGYMSKCFGEAEGACAGSTFNGDGPWCEGHAKNACADSTFEGKSSYCVGGYANACSGSSFSGYRTNCKGNESYGCANSTFTGPTVSCQGNAENACFGSRFKSRAYCHATASGGCDGAIYDTGSCCLGDFCPTGSPKCGSWNSVMSWYNVDGTW